MIIIGMKKIYFDVLSEVVIEFCCKENWIGGGEGGCVFSII